jgi:vacuolar iron transporter family protein
MNDTADLRKAFESRNIEQSKQLHSHDAVHERIQHKEHHKNEFKLPEIILGGQDGLVNVLGVILGVTAATSSTQLVIVAGLAAAFAESISMAAVAYTSKIAEADFYQSEYEREKWEIEHMPEGEKEEIRELYKQYGFEGEMLEQIVAKIISNKERWLQVMMEQELKMEPIERKEALPAAFIVGLSAIIGSFIPLTPYFFLSIVPSTIIALVISAITLFVVGFYKAKKTLGRNFIRQGLEMMIIGMVSALAGYVIGVMFQVKGI